MRRRLFCLSMVLLLWGSAISGTAFAAPRTDAETGPMLPSSGINAVRGVLFPKQSISGTSVWQSSHFSGVTGGGNYIRIWYKNNTNDTVFVDLHGETIAVDQLTVYGNSQGSKVYHTLYPDEEYFLSVFAPSGEIRGQISAAQYQVEPNWLSEGQEE